MNQLTTEARTLAKCSAMVQDLRAQLGVGPSRP